jgi:hypothetical protein
MAEVLLGLVMVPLETLDGSVLNQTVNVLRVLFSKELNIRDAIT